MECMRRTEGKPYFIPLIADARAGSSLLSTPKPTFATVANEKKIQTGS